MYASGTHLLALSLRPDKAPEPENFESAIGLGIDSIGRGSVGPEIVGLLRELVELEVLARGSVGLGREPEEERENHFVGFEKKFDIPEGEAERVKVGKELEGLTPN